jgi:hypothetical protein
LAKRHPVPIIVRLICNRVVRDREPMDHISTCDSIVLEARRLFAGTVFAAVALFSLAGAYCPGAHAQQGSFEDFPFLVYCELGSVIHAYYLSKIGPDGIAVYITPDNQAGTITIRGKAEPVGGDWSGSCAGKTLEQLRSAGQARDLQH